MQSNQECPISENAVLTYLAARPVTIRRIARFLRNRYGAFVDIQDVSTKDEPDQIDVLLTRSLAAHAVAVFSKQDPEMSARCVVDGGQDLGIDAIAFDEVEKRCWLFQSKFQCSGQGLMAWTDMTKFLDGFDALASERLEGANPKILKFESEIRRAVTEPGWKFTLVLASTSSQPLEEKSVKLVQDRLAYQDPGNSGTFTFEQFNLNAITTSVEQAFDAAKINLSVELHSWGCITVPFTAYYGQVSLDAVTKWREHGQPLFEKNLRGFTKSSPVSESIAQTLDTQSELFWYFNNGATILCERIERRGPYSQHTSRERGHFECFGVSVVNGAQTIGTIWEQPGNGEDLDPRGMLHVRLISLEDAPPDFAQQVTIATNTQKNILARDFATLDAVQRRLSREFRMEGRIYVFRQGDLAPKPSDGCGMEELSLALACSTSVELAPNGFLASDD